MIVFVFICVYTHTDGALGERDVVTDVPSVAEI